MLVVDLSLRNPLAKGFASEMLKTLLEPARYSRPPQNALDPESDLAWNLRCLSKTESAGSTSNTLCECGCDRQSRYGS